MLERSVGEVVELLEGRLVSREEVAALLRSEQAALVHAAVVHVDQRVRSGEWSLGEVALPEDLSRLPAESQLLLAALAMDGLGGRARETTADAAPLLRLAWLRAELLERPERLSLWESAPLGWEAAQGLPMERVIASGLLERLAQSANANVRELALGYVQKGLNAGFLSRSRAQALALALVKDESAVIALAALRFLKEAWSFGLALPALQPAADDVGDVEVALEVATVWAARGEIERIRRALWQGSPATLVPALLTGLGQLGDQSDVATLLEELRRDPFRCGEVALAALVALKRRGISPNDDEARALFGLLLAQSALDAGMAAEVLSSRADVVLGEVDVASVAADDWPQVVALLEALGTRRAIERLQHVVAHVEERDGWWYAISALGRLGIESAEDAVLSRLDDEPDACLSALQQVGGGATVVRLRERLAAPSLPSWARAAGHLLFELDPSTDVLASLQQRGLLDAELLDSVPGYAGLAQTELLGALAERPGHPARRSALRALGRSAGPLGVRPLADALGDADAAIREEAEQALRQLGGRLQALGAARPACLRASSEPGATMVADAALGRLRQRGLEPELAARLLEALSGIAHPQLVPVVRPYLRHRNPEVKKRAIACLAAAGPRAAAWLLPSLDDEDLTIARQALSALTRVRAVGLAGEVARWLDGRNMNLKKAAAEALATLGDRTVLPTLLHWLETHDNPGFRELLLGAVKFCVGDAWVGVLADRLDDAAEPRGRDLLLDALEHRLSVEQIAGLVHLRSEVWTTALLRKAYGGDWALAGGTLTELDHALAVRGLADRIPAPDTLEGEGAEAVAALRAGARLRRALRDKAEVGSLLAQANVQGQLRMPSLSPSDLHRLLDAYPGLDPAAQQGALQVLSGAKLDAVARVRVARLLEPGDTGHAPGELVRHVAATSSVQGAVQLQHSTDSRVHEAAARTLLLAGAVEPSAWPERDAARLLEQLLRRGALEPAFDWSLPRQQLPALCRALARRFGKSFAAARLGEWLQQEPALLPEILPELVRLGLAATRELERLARSSSIHVDVRERALIELSRRRTSELHALASELLEDSHVALRERAALVLIELGDSRDRERVLSAYLAGAFRERFYLSLTHADLPLLERAISSPATSRRPLVRLLEKFQDARRIPLLIEAWRTSQDEARAEARDALRRQDGALIWPHVKARLEQGTTAPLELIGRLDAIPESLVALLRESRDKDEWYAFIARVSGPGLLHAPGLAAVSTETLPEAALGLSVLLRLDDWSSRTGVEKLADTLAPLLRATTRETSLATIVEASTVLAGPLRVTLLARLGAPTDEIVVGALLDAVLDLPRLREELPAPLLAAVERRMARELDGDPERVRLILSYRASRAGTDEQARRSLVDQLEKSLGHSAPRVRSHALRLLREHAPRARYLEATQSLLHDRDPSTVRSAIRILGFGRHLSAIPGIAEHLAHSQAMVRDAARDALLHLGEDALPALRHAVSHARPDRRAALERVVADVERGIEAEEATE